MNYDEILKALADGVSPETIANNFANDLNAAIAQNEQECEKYQKEQKKKEDMGSIRSVIYEYFYEYYPEVIETEIFDSIFECPITDWINSFEDLVEMIVSPEWKALMNTLEYIKDIVKE